MAAGLDASRGGSDAAPESVFHSILGIALTSSAMVVSTVLVPNIGFCSLVLASSAAGLGAEPVAGPDAGPVAEGGLGVAFHRDLLVRQRVPHPPASIRSFARGGRSSALPSGIAGKSLLFPISFLPEPAFASPYYGILAIPFRLGLGLLSGIEVHGLPRLGLTGSCWEPGVELSDP